MQLAGAQLARGDDVPLTQPHGAAFYRGAAAQVTEKLQFTNHSAAGQNSSGPWAALRKPLLQRGALLQPAPYTLFFAPGYCARAHMAGFAGLLKPARLGGISRPGLLVVLVDYFLERAGEATPEPA